MTNFKLQILNLRNWIKNNKLEFTFLLLILVLGAFLRFYRLEELMVFLGDEGRDTLVMKRIVTLEHFPLVGPGTSVGRMYLGPIYYYMMAPFLWFFSFNPAGTSYGVALIGIATVFLIFKTASDFFAQKLAALSVSFLYAVSLLTTMTSRSSWNPNPAPFFSLLTMYSLFKVIKEKKDIYLVAVAVSLAISLQLHYLTVFLIPTVLASLFIFRPQIKLITYHLSFVIYLILMSPLLWFDLRHNFLNWRAFREFLTSGSTGFDLSKTMETFGNAFMLLNEKLIGAYDKNLALVLTVILSLIILVAIGSFLVRKKTETAFLLILIWFLVGILGLTFYRGPIYEHYLGFLYPLPFLILGYGLSLVKLKPIQILIIVFVLLLGAFNFLKTWTYITRPAGFNLAQTKGIVRLILDDTKDEPFNFSLLAKNNYDASYRYFMDLWGKKQEDIITTKRLYVVCEGEEVCRPEGNPKWEIAMFDAYYGGKIKREKEWVLKNDIKVFKFVPQ